jgi:hypothetical protein
MPRDKAENLERPAYLLQHAVGSPRLSLSAGQSIFSFASRQMKRCATEALRILAIGRESSMEIAVLPASLGSKPLRVSRNPCLSYVAAAAAMPNSAILPSRPRATELST